MHKINKISFILVLSVFISHAAASIYTDSRRYQAFAEAPYQQTLVVKQVVHGECSGGSTVTERADAWHCKVNDTNLDPCFVKHYKNKNQLICPSSPWQKDAIAVVVSHLLTPSRKSLDMSRALPWSVELTNGSHCRKLKPSEQNLNGEIKKYRCNNGEYLVGDFYRCKGLWQIFISDNGDYQTAFIKRAWF